MDVGSATPPVPGVPAAPVPTPCPMVTLMPGVPAVPFRLTFIDDLALPPDALALGFRLERVPAFGLDEDFVLDDAGTDFDRFILTATPVRGAEPFAPVLGAVVLAAPL